MTRRDIAAVVFDLGGVLIDWNPRHLYRKLFAGDEARMEEFLARVCTLEWHAQHDRGRPLGESCAELAARHPGQAELIMAWAERADEMIGGPVEDTVAVLDELRGDGVPCYALTNWVAETFPGQLERFGFLGWFEGIVVSGYERVAKPDPRIFDLLVRRFELDPGRTLFVDDAARNVEAARAAGMDAVLFRGADGLRAALRERGLLAGGGDAQSWKTGSRFSK